MENKENIYYRTPFYMTYPMQNLYITEMEYEKDMERMKELYPRQVRRIQEIIEKHCDEMEYEASRMYDENPDRFMLQRESQRLLDEFKQGVDLNQHKEIDSIWLRSLVEILFHDEIYRRRCRYRRCSRWW